MTPIPRPALVLGVAGVLPFAWGALSAQMPALADWGTAKLGARFVGPYVSLAYGTVIVSFMSGVLWGFATRASGVAQGLGYALSVVPALWAFFMVGGGVANAATSLMVGFAVLLALDWLFWRWRLAPAWWMSLRLLLTSAVLLLLAALLI